MTQPKIMRGMTELRTRVASFLQTELPLVIDTMRSQYALSAYQLPYPVRYDLMDVSQVTEYPAIGMLAAADNEHIRRDVTAYATKEYNVNYTTQMFIMALSPRDVNEQWIGDPKAESVRLRDDLLGAVKATLLETPSLKSNGLIEFREETMSTTYLEPMQVTTQAAPWLSTVIITADYRFREYTYQVPYGTANQITLSTAKLVP